EGRPAGSRCRLQSVPAVAVAAAAAPQDCGVVVTAFDDHVVARVLGGQMAGDDHLADSLPERAGEGPVQGELKVVGPEAYPYPAAHLVELEFAEVPVVECGHQPGVDSLGQIAAFDLLAVQCPAPSFQGRQVLGVGGTLHQAAVVTRYQH